MALRRVVITTLGSLGDLHPYLAIGQELQRRGYAVRVATLGNFRERVTAAGLEYAALRATTVEEPSPELMRRVFDGRTGIEYLVRQLVLPALRRAYEDTLAAADGAELLITHPLALATPLVVQQMRVPWLSTQLAPFGLPSAYDPPVLPGLGWLRGVKGSRWVFRRLLQLADRLTRRWVRPVDSLRAELGLPDRGNPLLAGGHSPYGVLALFPQMLAGPQPDWPARVAVTGFPFFAQDGRIDPVLEAWLADGPTPIIFTLGSSAVMTPGSFFAESVAAARSLGRRALLLGYLPEGDVNLAAAGGALSGGTMGGDKTVFAVPYAPYAQLFPRAAVTVHQGGIGTTAEALRAGRPMLVVPFGVDQPDNGARVARLGVARVVPRARYRAGRVAAMLRWLLQEGPVQRSEAVGREIRAENGAGRAVDLVEAVLHQSRPSVEDAD